ncbi:hydrogen peroxide-inducible genes activator [Sphingomonas sp.]|uniref:hydrogen peroxide-inducible genes activator n=1 Tax=Sphingomonas sp. TaxID=28214 RepID=UPI002D804C0D|nr:hydrogen peroxide-inducible genes activator [Sphingomonas sp.]HEU0044142.1 hydrogen peroxide-inducible genes activator [Sphingomonas sp.]
MLPLPSFRQLGYLLALHEQGHFGRAAAACFVTQSTLSVGIAELERLLGAQLVERSKRSVRFTEAGEEVVTRARTVMRAAEDLLAATQTRREPLTGTLRLAAIPTIAPFLLPRLLPAIERDWPRMQMFVREMLTGAACDALAQGTIDCVLLALPVECGLVDTAPIGSDRLLLAARDDDASAAAGELDTSRLLLLEDGHCLKDQALAACDLSRRATEAQLVASTLHTLVQLVDAGLGITLLPELAVDAGILGGTRVIGRPLERLDATRRIVLAWRKGDARGSDFGLLGRTIRDAAGLPIAP